MRVLGTYYIVYCTAVRDFGKTGELNRKYWRNVICTKALLTPSHYQVPEHSDQLPVLLHNCDGTVILCTKVYTLGDTRQL